MKLYLATTAALGLIGLSFAPTPLPLAQPAAAASGSQVQCEQAGGTYVKDGSNSICVFPPTTTKPGNDPPGTQGSETTTTTTTTGQGNLNNKDQTTTTCTGNPGQCK